jgi:hypothetical protein
VLTARITWGSRFVDFESRQGGELALPLADIVRQLADGRTHGTLTINGTTSIPYADVTSVEMSWSK